MIKWPEDLELEDGDSLEIQDSTSGMTITNNGWTTKESWLLEEKKIA